MSTPSTEQARPPAPPGGRHRRYRPAAVLAVLALLFFGAPGVSVAFGARAGQIENRELAPFPSPGDGWAFFPQLSQWATDHLPLRDRAVEANTQLSRVVFDELPATAGVPPVVEGRDGWLYLREDLDHACDFRAEQQALGSQFARMADLAGDLGVAFVSVVGPDKTTVETDRLPAVYPRMNCSREAKAALWDRVAADPPPGFVDLLPVMRSVKAEHGAAYKPQDTHFNDYGNVAYARALVAAIDPDVWARTEVIATGPRSTVGDLLVVLGQPGPTTFDGIELRRGGVTVDRHEAVSVDGVPLWARTTATSTAGAPLIPGRTVMFGDSYTINALPWLSPFFEELLLVEHRAYDPVAVARLLGTADRIVDEVVERTYVTNGVLELRPDYLALVTAGLSESRT